ncbi:hypothetical protein [Tenacibaculum haliotis]|uniref:hypothetical protein n=1 Tax=Tenacibaculum haliotis TaxID=1888914 RepID=UPI0021AE7D25|nr:hypothetical protein [Tenacibaculum haliotis]MCT4698123.1 hypothetical protein [Tenacibaculum haliotis]
MKYKLTFLLVIQVLLINAQLGNRNSLAAAMSFKIFENTDKRTKGTPYINKEFRPVKISGYKNTNLKARYNAHQDYFEVLHNGITKYLTVDSPLKITFVYSNKVYAAFNKSDKQNEKHFYVIKHNESSFKILLKEKIILREEIKVKTGYNSYTPAIFKKKKNIYFIKFENDKKVIEIPTKTRKFLNLFSDKSKELKKFIKKNKLKTKKEDDLIKIFKYYNTLK